VKQPSPLSPNLATILRMHLKPLMSVNMTDASLSKKKRISISCPILFFNRPFKKLPGYIMGGQLYNKKRKTISSQTLKRYERNLKKLLRDIFE